MKKLVVTVLAGALLALALAGCSSSDIPIQSAEKDAFTGYWKLESSASVGFEAYLNLSAENDLAEYLVADSISEGTWSVEDGKVTMTLEGFDPVTIQYTGEKLLIGSNDDTRMLFVKGDYGEAFSSEDDEAEADEAEATKEGEGGEAGEAAPEGEGDGDGAEEGDAVEEPDENPDIVDEAIDPIEPVTIVDDDTCAIQVTGRGTDFTSDPCYRLTFRNKTDKTLFVTVEEPFTVGDKSIDAGLGETAAPGQTIEATLYFPKDQLGGGLELLGNVTGTINVEIDDTYQKIADYPVHMD